MEATVLADQIGLDRLTGRDVATSLGVVPGLIYHYFPTIDDLIVEVFRRTVIHDMDQLHHGLAEAPPAEALKLFLQRALDGRRRQALSFWMSAWVAAPRRPSLSAEVDTQMIAGVARLAALLERGRGQGDFIFDNPTKSADCIYIALDGIAVQRTVRPTAEVDDDLAALIARTAEREVGMRAGTLKTIAISRAGA